jgi:hypothetical protein
MVFMEVDSLAVEVDVGGNGPGVVSFIIDMILTLTTKGFGKSADIGIGR